MELEDRGTENVMAPIIFFTLRAPYPLADEISRQGQTIYEALSIAEVFHLMEQHAEAQIIVAAEIPADRATLIQRRYPTLQLTSETTAADVIWELSHLARGANRPQ